jgi:outer membrane protein OmpA-like peptidoglycan-associated protein
MMVAYGCATVPDDAPQEFHNADAAIDKMDEQDSEDLFPKTTQRAHKTFDTALEMLDESREDQPTTTEPEAIDRAVEAKNIAEGVNRIHGKITQWDKNDMTFQAALASLDQMENPQTDVAIIAPQSPFAKLAGTEFVTTVAYFDTNSAESPEISSNELDALVAILKKDANYQVVLTGHADARGDSEYNKKLALNRAKQMATKLSDQGVEDAQVIVESAGESNASSEDARDARLQLDRKVQAKLVLN